MTEKHSSFSGSQSHSFDPDTTPNKQVYKITMPSGKQLFDGTVYVSVNGSFLSSNPVSQTTLTTDYDFYVSSSTTGQIAINKPFTGGVGITVDKLDDIVIKYTLTTAP